MPAEPRDDYTERHDCHSRSGVDEEHEEPESDDDEDEADEEDRSAAHPVRVAIRGRWRPGVG